MKKIFLYIILLSATLVIVPQKSHAVVWVVVKAALKKVIRAMDLQVQRLQNKTIALQNAQKVVENALSKLKLKEIATWTDQQKQLYQKYFDELWKIKNAITLGLRVADIIGQQKELVAEYKRAFSLFQSDKNFTPSEIEAIYQVYSNIIGESLKSVDDIITVINSFSVQMNDAERLLVLDNAAKNIDGYVADLRSFTQEKILLSLQRVSSSKELDAIKTLYGIK